MIRRDFIFTTAAAMLACSKAFATRKIVADEKAEFDVITTPYLCGGGTDSVNVVFAANKISLADIYVWSNEDPNFKEPVLFVESEPTGKKHIGTIHNIRIDGLKDGKTYFYKIVAKEVIKYWNHYKKNERYGETLLGKIITIETNSDNKPLKFTLPKEKSKSLTFAVMNDVHEMPKKINNLFKALPNNDYEFLVMNGDTLNYMMEEDRLFKNSIGVIANNLKSVKPVYYLRGNHETRGKTAEDYFRYFPTPTGKTYFAFRAGPAFFLFLDLCEDKPDTATEGAHLNDFTKYRNEEVKWLKEVVNHWAFKKAKYRIAIQHIPPIGEYLAYRTNKDLHICDVLKNVNLDLMLCGHVHAHKIIPKGEDGVTYYGNNEKRIARLKKVIKPEDSKAYYPIVINSNEEAMLVHLTEENIKIEFFDTTGKKSQPDFFYNT